METIKLRIEELTKRVWDNEFNANSREVSDYQYESMFKKLCKLEKRYPEYADPNSPTLRLGSNTTNRFRTFKHPYPMHYYRRGNIDNILELLHYNKELICEDNIEGLRVTISYLNGKLQNVVTIGNGLQGKEITQNARTISNIPFFIPLKEHVDIRGVIYYPESEFRKHSKSNAQFKSVGHAPLKIMMSEKSKMVVKHRMHFCANYLISACTFNISYLEMTEKLREMKFELPHCKICKTPDVIQRIIAENNSGEIPTNGRIFRLNKTLSVEERNKSQRFEPNALLWYFPNTVQKKIMGVDWAKNKAGNIIPSIVFETPLKVNGSTYYKVSLKNIGKFKHLNLHYNDTAEIDLSTGKPELLKILNELRVEHPFPINAPNHCPYCGSELSIRGMHLICTSSSCSPNNYSSPVSNSFRHELEFDCFGDWKYMHLKIVANFFGARAIKKRDEDGKTKIILQFNSCNQVADITYTFNAEKMPVKIFVSDFDTKYEVNSDLKSFGRKSSSYLFYSNRFSTSFEEIKSTLNLPYLKLMEIDGLMSFMYNDNSKYRDIRFFFSYIASYKSKPIHIITKDPNLKPKPPVKKSFWKDLFSPAPVVKF